MITDLLTVHAAFFSLFGTAISTAGFVVPVSYAGASRDNFSELVQEVYPSVAIQDYAPLDLKEMWCVSGERTFYNERDTDGDGINDTADEIGDPSFFEFRYDVSSATKDFKASQALLSWFYRKFPRFGTIEIAGERYSYERTSVDLPRSDGVFEHSHEFKLKIWYYAEDPIVVVLATEVKTSLVQGDVLGDPADPLKSLGLGVGTTLIEHRNQYPFTNQSQVQIAHYMGRLLTVTVYDLAGNEVEADITALDLNTILIHFSQPLTGTVVLT